MDIRSFFSGSKKTLTMKVTVEVNLPKRRKYRHTPKWFKKKMLQELSVTLEHLKNQERNILKNVVCECY